MTRAQELCAVDSTAKTPRYVQAQNIMIQAITDGRLPPGSRIPSTREIGAQCNVSLITAHKALEGLVQNGWLRREHGRGTFVRDAEDISLAEKPRLNIGLLLHERACIDDYYHAKIMEGLRREARVATQHVEFFFHESYGLCRPAYDKSVGLICFHPPSEREKSVRRLAQKYPVVVLGGSFETESCLSIDCDNYSGGWQVADHLLELGHRRFFLLSGPTNLSNTRERVAGVRDRLRASGIELGSDHWAESDDSVAVDKSSSCRLYDQLRSTEPCTAVIAGGFYLALEALNVIRQGNLRIPQDVSLVGFDDPEAATYLSPPLTTVRQPLSEMAVHAFRGLESLVRDPKQSNARSVKLRTELVVRASTGPPYNGH